MNIDTNTVNFAVDKISAAVSKAMPTVTAVSKELVSYTVTNQVLTTVMSLMVMMVSVVVWIPIYRYFKKHDGEWDNPLFMLPTLILILVLITAFLVALVTAQDTIMALNYPEMFTAMRMIGK